MLEQIILGIIQGIAEWLPVSSEGLIVLAKTQLFHTQDPLAAIIKQALVLHFGTVLAAIVYFRKDCVAILKSLGQYNKANQAEKTLLNFLITTTLFSGAIGFALLKILINLANVFNTQADIITLAVGVCLLLTAYLELKAKRSGYRSLEKINWLDIFLLSVAQGLAALPGLSRSGLTVSALLLRKVDKTTSLKLSFLMSIPIVIAGNITLHLTDFSFSMDQLAGVFCAFLFGLATIHILLKAAQKINFGYFVLFFGLLTIASVFV